MRGISTLGRETTRSQQNSAPLVQGAIFGDDGFGPTPLDPIHSYTHPWAESWNFPDLYLHWSLNPHNILHYKTPKQNTLATCACTYCHKPSGLNTSGALPFVACCITPSPSVSTLPRHTPSRLPQSALHCPPLRCPTDLHGTVEQNRILTAISERKKRRCVASSLGSNSRRNALLCLAETGGKQTRVPRRG